MLGPLEVRGADGAAVYVAGARLRALLITLALTPGRLVPTARLVDAIWGDDPPAGAVNALQALVSRLRRALPITVEGDPAGYRLTIDPDDVDVVRFERLVAAGRRADDTGGATRILGEALALWRGPALLDVADLPLFEPSRARLEELRLAATEDRAAACLRPGQVADVVDELTALAAEHPLRERLIAALMRALAVAGRPAEALVAYERTREALADRLGTDPSPELSALHTAVLRGEIQPTREPAPEPAAPAPEPDALPPRTNVPAPLTSFVGRDADIEKVQALVAEYRLTTLVGPGGAGKTRLAVETCRTVVDHLPDGVWLVELAPITEPADLVSAVLAALGLRDQSLIARETTDDPAARLVSALRQRSALLVFDNCEHLIGAAAELADRLLGECPRLRLLATSREPLGLTGEAVWSVAPLALPPAAVATTSAEVQEYDATRLLVDRARAVQPSFILTDADASDVARICRALDGMPLAIELAAARLRSMTAGQLADRLDDRFRLLTGGSRTALPRHQTLRAVVDWSWELLSAAERAVAQRLAVFAGGATLQAAERVCAGRAMTADDVLGVLTGLVDKSLLVADLKGDPPRYRMLETIKAYARERLDEAGESDQARQAHTSYVIDLVETAEPHLLRSEQLEWLRRLEADHDDITAAVRGAIAAGDARTAVRLVAAAGWYWWLGGHKSEGLELATTALGVPGETDDAARATACAMVAYFSTAGLGDVRGAERWVREAEKLAAGLDQSSPLLRFMRLFTVVTQDADPRSEGRNELVESLIADDDPWVRGQTRLARSRLLDPAAREADIEQAVIELRSVGERWGLCYALTVRAEVAARRGDLPRALECADEAVALMTETGNIEDLVLIRAAQAQLHWLAGDLANSATAIAEAERAAAQAGWPDGQAMFAFVKADLARWSGDFASARAELAKAESTLRDVAVDPTFRTMILDSLAYVDAADGALDRAAARRTEALESAFAAGDPPLMNHVLVGVADHGVQVGRLGDAARLLAASELVTGGPDRSRPDGARVADALRSGLGAAEFAEATEHAREELAGIRCGEPVAAEAIRELATSVLGTSAPAAG